MPAADKKTNSKHDYRSSYEFMTSLILASLTQLVPSLDAYVICWIALTCTCVYFCWSSRATEGYSSKRKVFLSVCVVAFICAFAGSGMRQRYRNEYVVPPALIYMTGWGGNGQFVLDNKNPPHLLSGDPGEFVEVNGSLLMKYQKRFNLMAIAMHVVNNESYMDKSNICRSAIQRIRPEVMSFHIPVNDQFLSELQKGTSYANYILLAVPKQLNADGFTTLNEAEDKGAEVLQEAAASEGQSHIILPLMQPQK